MTNRRTFWQRRSFGLISSAIGFFISLAALIISNKCPFVNQTEDQGQYQAVLRNLLLIDGTLYFDYTIGGSIGIIDNFGPYEPVDRSAHCFSREWDILGISMPTVWVTPRVPPSNPTPDLTASRSYLYIVGETYGFILPLWLPLIASSSLLIFLFIQKVRLGRNQNYLCLCCSYNLTGNQSGTCPECGSAVTARPPSSGS